jgi:CRISPR-associated protein Csb2
MFSLGIRYLNGWAMAAADGAKKETAEWPPHPDRLFMALAAAWFETGKEEFEGSALHWLENQSPPSLYASDAFIRQMFKNRYPIPVMSYVPVNDSKVGIKIPNTNSLEKLKDAGLTVLPEYRSRQPRRFPVVIPFEENLYFIWTELDPSSHEAAFSNLCNKVVRIGHSASFVQMWVEKNPPLPNFIPVDGVARHRLRVFGPGRLEYLEKRCNLDAVITFADLTEKVKSLKGKDKKTLKMLLAEQFNGEEPVTLRPESGLWHGYDSPPPLEFHETIGSVFDPRFIVLKMNDSRLSLIGTLKLSETLRGAIMAKCPMQPPPEWVSGHTNEGKPSEMPHLAFVPMAFVGAKHADGRIMGASLVLPRDIPPEEAGACLNVVLGDEHGLPKKIRLFDGQWFECNVEVDLRESPPFNMRAFTWTQPSRVWASITPVVLDRHYDGPDKWDKAAIVVKDACERIGLPRPSEVILQPTSLVEGTPHAREFPYLKRKRDGGRMHHTHAVLIFDQKVCGPILIGAGRYRGYGFFRPTVNLED